MVNIDDKRLDPKPEDIDPKVTDNMLRRLQDRKFCYQFYSEDGCRPLAKGECEFRHETLNPHELLFLQQHARHNLCDQGSSCRRANCRFGHSCPNEPGCHRRIRCPFRRFHGIDTTVVGVRNGKRYG